MKQFIYNGEPVFLKAESYRNNGRLALVMVSNDGTIRDVITVNLNSCFQSGSTAFLDTNNYPDIEKWIRKHYDLTPEGIIQFLGLRYVDYNYTSTLGHFWRQWLPWENDSRPYGK